MQNRTAGLCIRDDTLLTECPGILSLCGSAIFHAPCIHEESISGLIRTKPDIIGNGGVGGFRFKNISWIIFSREMDIVRNPVIAKLQVEGISANKK